MRRYLIILAMLAVALAGNAQVDVQALTKAEKKGSMEAARQLAEYYYDNYDFDAAATHAHTWETLLKKDRKISAEDRDEATAAIDDIKRRAIMAKNMLERVEHIVILDSIVVDKADFFTHYRLSPEAGRLFGPTAMPYTDGSKRDATVVHMPQTASEVFYAVEDDEARLTLMSAQVAGNAFVEPAAFDTVLNDGGDADYMFMESDGMTFYFANDGDASLGGYDIFMSRRQPDGSVYQPQNMGMPYNSPYDDYMLAIDEEANLGWWATDRNQIPGMVTIYVFRPNPARVNYDPADPQIADYAFVRSMAATWLDQDEAPTVEYPKSTVQQQRPDEFVLSLGDGRVYTNMSQFRVPEAVYVMQDLLSRQAELADMRAQLDALRQRYAQGDHAVDSDILSLEKRILAADRIIRLLTNQVIQTETRK